MHGQLPASIQQLSGCLFSPWGDSSLCLLNLVYHETINQVNLDWHKIVGILWSITTIKSNLYSNTLNDIWILPVTIDDNSTLDKINNIIKKVIWWDKITNDDKDVLKNSLSILKTKWATAVILWCTELPIAFNLIDTNIKLYDPLIITIRKACNKYYNNK